MEQEGVGDEEKGHNGKEAREKEVSFCGPDEGFLREPEVVLTKRRRRNGYKIMNGIERW